MYLCVFSKHENDAKDNPLIDKYDAKIGNEKQYLQIDLPCLSSLVRVNEGTARHRERATQEKKNKKQTISFVLHN